ncbi:MAG: DUF4136 domain-containing protein [Pseudomonadales bacterium]
MVSPIRRLVFAATGLLLVVACASTPRISVVRDPGADIAGYQTFAFYEPVGTDRPDGTGTVLSQNLKQAARRELESLGYAYDIAHPDLRLNFFVETREVIEGYPGPDVAVGYGYYRHPYGVWSGYYTDIRQYTESTLHVDVVDEERNQLVWEAVSTERLQDHDLTYEMENVSSSIAEIFADFPLRRLQ